MGDPLEHASPSHVLRMQEAEFYEALTVLLASTPRGTTVDEALRSPKGQRLRQKWTLKYGRQPPL